MVNCLHGDGAQTFIDLIDQVRYIHSLSRTKYGLLKLEFAHPAYQALDRPDLSLRTRKRCLKLLYRMCGRHALLPKALRILVSYERTGVALYRGGFADVWKGEHCGRDVAVKVIRTYSNTDLQKMVGVGIKLRYPPNVCVLTALYRGSARRSLHGKPFGIQMCCRW